MKLKPTRDIVLVRADKVQEKTKSGFYIKEEWKSVPPFGTVEAVGPEVKTVKPGDRILFERYSSIRMEGDLRLIKENGIQAIVEDENGKG
jgi:chaperonin GroES